VSHDLHLEVIFRQNPIPVLPPLPPGPPPPPPAAYREAMQQNNCTFEKVQILPRNIGYVKLNSFPHPSVCGTTARAAMASVNRADAIIFDLRDNRGGFPAMVMLLAAYLFDHPVEMYNPRETTTPKTESPVSGSSLANKPVYVLTSRRTFSGAEHFSYDLKMLKRATLVGETTAGASDLGMFHRLDEHFGIGIRESRVVNPYSEPDWAVVGVPPNVKVPADDALVTAQRLAEAKLKTK
jgi:C-terminal processing protease CtpA/Prc